MLNDISPEPFKEIDCLYLDNTFSTSDEDFPSQPKAYEMLKNTIIKFRK